LDTGYPDCQLFLGPCFSPSLFPSTSKVNLNFLLIGLEICDFSTARDGKRRKSLRNLVELFDVHLPWFLFQSMPMSCSDSPSAKLLSFRKPRSQSFKYAKTLDLFSFPRPFPGSIFIIPGHCQSPKVLRKRLSSASDVLPKIQSDPRWRISKAWIVERGQGVSNAQIKDPKSMTRKQRSSVVKPRLYGMPCDEFSVILLE
jgi:hypothetical protein